MGIARLTLIGWAGLSRQGKMGEMSSFEPAPSPPGTRAVASPTDAYVAPEHWSLPTLLQVIRNRARQQPDELAFTFLLDGEHQTANLTFAGLDRRARDIAYELSRRGRPGGRALVVLEPGLDYIASLVGCFYAGVVPVPVYPPDPFRIARTMPRLQAIFGSAECELLISTAEILGGPDGTLRKTCPLGAIEMESIAAAPAGDTFVVDAVPDDLALLQYTSGTTGEPRGVPISHANLVENLRGMERLLDVDRAIAVQWLPPYHDLGLIGGIFLPLFAGRRSVLMSPLSFIQSPARWLRAMSDYRATTSAAPNFGFELCLRKVTDAECQGLDLSNWRVAVSGAEPVRADTLDRFVERFAPYGFRREALIPAYGMAETTLMVSVSQQDVPPREIELDSQALSRSKVVPRAGGRRIVGCGPAGPDVEVRVVDPKTSRETTGVGEVWVRSPSVASGYWRQDELSASQFNQTIAGTQATGFLRTGDLGFLDPTDGELFLVGRQKEMIILAGRNYYPQDIELSIQASDAALKTDGGAAVTVEVDNAEQLAIFQEVQRPKRQDLQALLTTARRVAAEETGQEPYRVVLLPVGELPKTSSGKTRRAECWELYESGALTVLAEWPASGEKSADASEYETPETDTEKWLAKIWAEVLALGKDEPVGRTDNFFALGGRSLQVTQMLAEVVARTGVVLPLKALFDYPTLSQLAGEIEKQASELPTSTTSDAAPQSVDWTKPQPLSASQQRFWMIERLGVPGGANVPIALRLESPVPAEALQSALDAVVARHPALRTRFKALDADPKQQVVACRAPQLETLGLVGDTLEALLAEEWIWRPFDVSDPPLLRAGVVDIAAGEQVLLLVVHHLVADGGSIDILLSELADLLAGETLPELNPTLPTIAVTELSASDEVRSYWQERLADVPATIDLPLGEPSGEITVAAYEMSAETTTAVELLAKRLHTTPFVVYLSVFQLVLSRYASQRQVGVGVAMSGRGAAEQGTVGCFINTLPLFATIDGGTYQQFVQQLQQQLLADLDHARLPWEAIVDAASKPRSPGRMPLVQTFFVHDDQRPRRVLAGAEVLDAATDYRGLAVFDASLVVESARPQPMVKLVHDAGCLAPALAERFLATFVATLSAVVENSQCDLHDLPIIHEEEYQQLSNGGEPTGYPDPPSHSVDEWIRHQAERTPEATAVVCGAQSLTYAELQRQAERIAGALASQGVTVGDRVGLLLRRTIDLPAAILGTWRAGAAYVPLDPEYPESRLQYMADDAELACLIADPSLTSAAPASQGKVLTLAELISDARATLPTELPANRLAYVMYTSGSTGKPKGVMLPHRAVANLLNSFAEDTGIGPGDRLLASTTISFDISVLELFLPLATGATIVLADDETAGDGTRLKLLIESSKTNYLQAAPSTFRLLLSAGWHPTSEQTLLCGGEEVTPDLAAELHATAGRLWNVYGPTETTVWSTYHAIEQTNRAIPIGKPIAGTRCYVVGTDGRPCPLGAWGELAIAGTGVADGYWKQAGLTDERFPPDPFHPSQRMYLTGDLARWSPGSKQARVLEFGGRLDSQVKVRGHRIELREIEIALNAHEAVGESAVVATDAGASQAALVAYVTSANGKPWTPAELREHLGTRLPSYMTPSAFVAMDRLPRTDNGKIDRKRLPRDNTPLARTRPMVTARTPLEEKIASWVCQLLRIDQVGVFDNFFEIGGQSLLATQLVVRMRDELGVEPPLREVYQQPTIAAWAALVMQSELDAGGEDVAELLDQLDNMTEEAAAEMLRDLPLD